MSREAGTAAEAGRARWSSATGFSRRLWSTCSKNPADGSCASQRARGRSWKPFTRSAKCRFRRTSRRAWTIPSSIRRSSRAEEHSVAAPTAGLHFTQELLDDIQRAGVHLAKVELDVGLDTFRPVSVEDPAEHHIHTEHYRVPAYTAEAVNAAHKRGARVIAVGTTSVRALESAFNERTGLVEAAEGLTDLFILPGFSFGAVDAMVTNFHVPRSTLMMMVSAFAGREQVMNAYRTAMAEKYRFLSFGDAMLIV